MRFALSCLLSLLLLASALWPGEASSRAGAAELAAPTLALQGACESWETLGSPPDELARRSSAELPPLTADDSAEVCSTPAPAVPALVPEGVPRPRVPAARYVGPWLRVPQRPPSGLA